MTAGSLSTKRTWSEIMADLKDELRKWNIHEWIPPSVKEVEAGGAVTVRFKVKGVWQEVTCGRWPRGEFKWKERNLLAITLAIESVRMMDQRGILGLTMDVAKRLALPEAGGSSNDPYTVLGVSRDAPRDVIMAAYRARVKATHPDTNPGADPKDLQRVIEAGKALGLDKA